MSVITLPDGTKAYMVATPEVAAKHQATVNTRHQIALDYCRAQGWPEDPEKLSIDQILEIRRAPGWKDAWQ